MRTRILRFLIVYACALSIIGAPLAILSSACINPNARAIAVTDTTLAATSAAAARLEPLLEAEYEAAQRTCPLTDDPCFEQVRSSWARAWVAYRAFRAAWIAVDEAADVATKETIDLCPLFDAAHEMDTAIGQLGPGALRTSAVVGLVLDQLRLLMAASCIEAREAGAEGGVQQ